MTPLEEDLIRALTNAQTRERHLRQLCDQADAAAFQPPGILSTEYVRIVLDGGVA